MKMIKAVVRPEKSSSVLDELNKSGFRAVTKYSVLGRGNQRGLRVGDIYYDEIAKSMIMIVVNDEDVNPVLKIIEDTARTDKNGNFGDGKIFVLPVEKVITISSGAEE